MDYFRNYLHKDILIMWNDKDGIWYDYDLLTNKSRKYFYMSNFVPLWTKSHKFSSQYLSHKIYRYIFRNALTRFIGGTPTSFEFSSEQWDFPNAWPPLQEIFIQGLENIGTTETSRVAFRFTDIWIRSNYRGFKKFKTMFEKYDSLTIGESGKGGEYVAQYGFGWTNGVILELLNKWGSELTN